MQTIRVSKLIGCFSVLTMLLASTSSFAAKPCDRDAGECRSQDAKRNANYDGGGGVCRKNTATANGAQITIINAGSAAACSAAGGKWESNPGGKGGSGGTKP